VLPPEPPPNPDPFPRDRFTALVRRLPRYARLAWTLSRHPKVRGKQRAVLAAAAVYLISPIDLVPGFIPVLGQLDDAAAILIGLGMALRSLTPEDRAAALASAQLEAGDLDADLRTIGASYAWMGRKGLRLGKRAAGLVGRGVGRAASGIRSRVRNRGKPAAGPDWPGGDTI
jgi:uncharacterized membrane protein YkvA (DUF1232 family)